MRETTPDLTPTRALSAPMVQAVMLLTTPAYSVGLTAGALERATGLPRDIAKSALAELVNDGLARRSITRRRFTLA